VFSVRSEADALQFLRHWADIGRGGDALLARVPGDVLPTDAEAIWRVLQVVGLNAVEEPAVFAEKLAVARRSREYADS
jgi:hypothetical protein